MVMSTKAAPVPSTPSGTMASTDGQANDEEPRPHSPNGASRARAASWALSRTGRAPWRCWRGTARLTARPYRTTASSTRPAPSMVARDPWSWGQEMARTPANPISSPSAWALGRGRRSSTTAQAAPARGTAPFSMPATEESIHCWATGNSSSGSPAQMTPRKATRTRSCGPIGRRAAGTSDSAATPSATLARAITPGASASRPTSMNRNDDPQMRAMLASSPHSRTPNASVRLPLPVSSSGLRIGTSCHPGSPPGRPGEPQRGHQAEQAQGRGGQEPGLVPEDKRGRGRLGPAGEAVAAGGGHGGQQGQGDGVADLLGGVEQARGQPRLVAGAVDGGRHQRHPGERGAGPDQEQAGRDPG